MFKLFKTSSRALSVGRRTARPSKTVGKPTTIVSAQSADLQAPPPPATDLTLAWTEVKDQATGQIYYWNKMSNETTALGAPRPTGPTAIVVPGQQQQSLGGMVVEGMAWGTGMAIARHMVGSVFSMFGGGDDNFSV